MSKPGTEICFDFRGKSTVLVESPQDSRFELFQKLPKDLRRRIWRCALPGPRLLNASELEVIGTDSTPSNPLSVAQACPESCHEVLKRYNILSQELASEVSGDFRLINFQIDTLYFGISDDPAWAALWVACEQVKNNLRFLALTNDAWASPAMTQRAIKFIQKFRKLEELSVVFGQDGSYEGPVTDWTLVHRQDGITDRCSINDFVDVAITTPLVSRDYAGSFQWIAEANARREYAGLKNLKVKILYLVEMGEMEFDDLRESKSHSYFYCSHSDYQFETGYRSEETFYESDPDDFFFQE
jgi:hypothetical protein